MGAIYALHVIGCESTGRIFTTVKAKRQQVAQLRREKASVKNKRVIQEKSAYRFVSEVLPSRGEPSAPLQSMPQPEDLPGDRGGGY